VIDIAAESLDERGMVFDFSDVKKVIAGWIDENLDHRMILNRQDPVVPIFEEMNEPVFLLDDNPTAENIAKLIFDFAQQAGFPIVKVDLWETPQCFASYS
jgi:6-pyruvoyltetrahydropterin/6-carboxytetrahydropterin synthase